jgi:nitric oxide reductase NorQ protein
MMKNGVAPQEACELAMVRPITDDAEIRQTLFKAIEAVGL